MKHADTKIRTLSLLVRHGAAVAVVAARPGELVHTRHVAQNLHVWAQRAEARDAEVAKGSAADVVALASHLSSSAAEAARAAGA